MGVGQSLRRLLGPLEDSSIRLFRRLFVDLEAFGGVFSRLPAPSNVLEIGCGDGHMCEVIAKAFPQATTLGIDIAPDPGRLYRGDRERVAFRQVPAQDLIEETTRYDLVVLNDVLHHVPTGARMALLASAWGLIAENGRIVVKDWSTRPRLMSFVSYLFERFVTGDRVEYFSSGPDLADLLESACPGGQSVEAGTVPPHRNNIFVVIAKPSEQAGYR